MKSQRAERAAELALLRRGDDADRLGAGELAQLQREHAQAAGRAPHEHAVAGLQLHLVDQHAVGGEVRQPVGGRLLPREVLGLGQQLLGLHLAELRERAPGRLVAPDLLRRRGERVQAVDLDVLVGGLVAVDDDLVAGLPAGHALADLPDDARRVRAADVVVLGVVAEHRDGLAERRPHVVEVHAGRHHAHDDLEGARLGRLHLLELEGVDRLAEALLADHPGGHRRRQLARLGVQSRDLADVNGHVSHGSCSGPLTSKATRLTRESTQALPLDGWPEGRADFRVDHGERARPRGSCGRAGRRDPGARYRRQRARSTRGGARRLHARRAC